MMVGHEKTRVNVIYCEYSDVVVNEKFVNTGSILMANDHKLTTELVMVFQQE